MFADLAASALHSLLQDRPQLAPVTRANYGRYARSLAAAAAAYAGGGRPLAAATAAAHADLLPLLRRLDGAGRSQAPAELIARPAAMRDEIVPGLLHSGLSLLGARTLAGKSFLALQAALAVGSGSSLRGLQAAVLFLCLEDTPQRLSRRLHQLGAARCYGRAGLPIDFYLHWPALDDEGLPLLAQTLAHGPDREGGGPGRSRSRLRQNGYRFVVIDTLSAAVTPSCRHSRAALLDVLRRLHALAAAGNAAVLLVDRHAYPAQRGPLDPVDHALAAAYAHGLLEQAITLHRPFGQQRAELRFAPSGHTLVLPRHPDIAGAESWQPSTIDEG